MTNMIGARRAARIWTLVILHGSVSTARIFCHLVQGRGWGVDGGGDVLTGIPADTQKTRSRPVVVWVG